MLRSFESYLGDFEFVDQSHACPSDDNKFTVIVGKNGTGKSRLLRNIVLGLVANQVNPKVFSREDQVSFKSEQLGWLDIDYKPEKIICASTSPFDKFPTLRRDSYCEEYSYLGLRGLPSSNLGLSYMSKIVFTLIAEVVKNDKQAASVSGVLEYLGYVGEILITLSPPSSSLIADLSVAGNPYSVIEEYLRRPKFFSTDLNTQLRQLLDLDDTQLSRVIDSARRLESYTRRRKLVIAINNKGLHFFSEAPIDSEDIVLAVTSGLFRLREVELHKPTIRGAIRFSEASSGEQSVVMSLLGIGSQIRDGSLICIDEPEICLHPEWQEKYIELLFHTFSSKKNCHFLIATHSPQIVAQIPDGSCYVMSMSDGKAQHASKFAHRSIDFQLAEVFDAPGYKNEYLSRIALNAFAKVSRNKKFDYDSKKTLEHLRRSKGDLRSNDPLNELIVALEEMACKYG
ncbi:TPA: ATP-binding protein [Pseudomonas aeruginosa]|nr:ATP-binding protein [Pseudomonas aeruginosa]HDQ4722647.1 ATP-binding protein [Pseudomonas aeruginosa]